MLPTAVRVLWCLPLRALIVVLDEKKHASVYEHDKRTSRCLCSGHACASNAYLIDSGEMPMDHKPPRDSATAKMGTRRVTIAILRLCCQLLGCYFVTMRSM